MNRSILVAPGARTAREPMSVARLGDFTLAGVWGLLSLSSLIRTVSSYDSASVLASIHNSLATLILFISAALFIFRSPAISRTKDWRFNVIAIVGTWMMPVLIQFPLRWTNGPVLTISVICLIVTHLIMFWAVLTLRNSFSIFPEARKLIRTGPYRYVRHPLYANYLVMYTAFLLPRFGPIPLIIAVVGFGCEILRARQEEVVLKGAIPEYAQYAEETPRFFPKLSSLA